MWEGGSEPQWPPPFPRDPADPPDPPDPAEVGAASAVQTLPSTRAGGQDDGSLTNSLKREGHVFI